MTAFETVGASADEINACFDKWARVLRSVGVPANATFVAATLQRTGLVGTRKTRPHSDTIYNSDEVARVLGKVAHKYPWISYRDGAGHAQAHDHRSSGYEGEEERGALQWLSRKAKRRERRKQREDKEGANDQATKTVSYNSKVARVCIPPKAGSTSFWVSHDGRSCMINR